MQKIAFLIVNYNISGGMNMVLQYAAHLKRSGHDVVFVSEESLPSGLQDWFAPAGDCRRLSFAEAAKESFDLAVVTFWSLLLRIPRFPAARFVNFVQRVEYEPLAAGKMRTLVRELTALPLDTVAVSGYIANTLANGHGISEERISTVYNGIDKTVFYPPVPAHPEGVLRVLVEGPVTVPFKNVAAAVRAAREGGADEVNLLTSSAVREFPDVDRVFSNIPHEKTGDVYRTANLLVKMSLSEGMCLPPLEMFHCGGSAVMYDLPPVFDYAEDGVNCLLVPTGDEAGIVRAVRELRENPARLRQLSQRALETATRWPEPEASAVKFASALERARPRPEVSGMIRGIIRRNHPACVLWEFKRKLRRAQARWKAGR